MARRWRGVLAQENVQTGDGRVFAPGALEWAPLPLPLAWLVDGDQHIMPSAAPVIGNIDRIERVDDDVWGWGVIDDETSDDGRTFVARLEAGTAPKGNRWGLSIDADNWTVQVVATEPLPEDEEVVLIASGRGQLRSLRALVAEAGDPDVEPSDEQVLFENSSGAIIERVTSLRIRGVTAVAVDAFAGAYIELDPDESAAVDEEPADDEQPADAADDEPLAASASIDLARPPLAWFTYSEADAAEHLVEQLDGTHAVPLTITDDGHVFGHVAAWGSCHVGFLDQCVTPPPSPSDYAFYNLGAVHTDDGVVATGPLIVNCDHAPLYASMVEARDHYAHAGMGWADVHMSAGEHGPWFSGALRPGVTPEQVRVLRSLAPSGDWRPDSQGRPLDLVAVLAVNTPGFPITREALAASGLAPAAAHDQPAVGLAASGALSGMVAAGMVSRCADCTERARTVTAAARRDDDVLVRLERMERVLMKVAAPVLAAERDELLARIRA